MILTIAQLYVTEKMRYANGFIHARVKSYKTCNIDSEVFVLQKKKGSDYIIDGINVKIGNIKRLVDLVNNNNEITCLCFHFLNPYMLKVIKRISRNIPICVFVHGNEALWWYERIFPDRFRGFIRTLKFFKYVVVNTYSICSIRQCFKNIKKEIKIICVSDWMKNVTIKNWRLYNKFEIYVIPNVINENIFPYTEKTSDLRFKILMIRKFDSGKYALDIAMDTIIKLSNYPEFEKIQITIIGDGWLFDTYTSMVKKYKNIKINRNLLSQEEVAKEHSLNGFFLCPTRQDAQGVSMCEAMASGLVPLTSNNTAIPEYLPARFQLAFNSSEEIADRIISLIRNEQDYLELSKAVSDFIINKCSVEKTVEKEISLMKSLSKINK